MQLPLSVSRDIAWACLPFAVSSALGFFVLIRSRAGLATFLFAAALVVAAAAVTLPLYSRLHLRPALGTGLQGLLDPLDSPRVDAFVGSEPRGRASFWMEGRIVEIVGDGRGGARLRVDLEELWAYSQEQLAPCAELLDLPRVQGRLVSDRSGIPEPLSGRVSRDEALVAHEGYEGPWGCRVRGAVSLRVRFMRGPPVNGPWMRGQRVGFESRLKRMRNFGNPSEFDWAAWNARRGMIVSAFVWSDDSLRLLDRSGTGAIEQARRAIAARLSRLSKGGALLAALLVGERGALDELSRRHIRDAGLAHVLAISGLHMGIVTAFVFWLVRASLALVPAWASAYDIRRPAAIAAGLAAICYAGLSGGGISVERSLLMTLAALAALWRGSSGQAWKALSLAAVIIALRTPGVLSEAAFQLSFSAVATLLLYSQRRACRTRHRRLGPISVPHRVLVAALELSIISLLCWLVTAPIIAHHFTRVSLLAPAVNIAAALPVATSVVLGMGASAMLGLAGLAAGLSSLCATLPAVAAAASALSALAAAASDHVFGYAALAAGLLLRISAGAASLPFCAVWSPSPGPVLTLLLSLLPAVALLPREFSRRLLPSLLIAVSLLCAHGAYQRFRSDRLDLWFLSVGQGDSTLARLPGGDVLLVDAGVPGRGNLVVAPMLRRLHIGRIDYLVASHIQSDHWGGLRELAGDFEIGEFIYPGGVCAVEGFHEWIAELVARGVRVRSVPDLLAKAQGSQMVTGASPLHFLWPRDTSGACNANDRSVVVSLSFGGRRVLLAGDMEAEGEAALLRTVSLPTADCGAAGAQTAGLVSAAATGTATAGLVTTTATDAAASSPIPTVAATAGSIPPAAANSVAASTPATVSSSMEAAATIAGSALTAATVGGSMRDRRLAADVVKAPHHGSKTSSSAAFIAATAPALAVASAGHGNRFGFPDPAVEAAYRAAGARFLSTSRDGAVRITLWASGDITYRATLSGRSGRVRRSRPDSPAAGPCLPAIGFRPGACDSRDEVS